MSQVEQQLGKRVAQLRQLAGLTQAECAEKVGVATETISRFERGAAVPSLARIEKVAGVLGVGLHELFIFREGTPKDEAVERLMARVRSREAQDIEVVADIAERVFRRW